MLGFLWGAKWAWWRPPTIRSTSATLLCLGDFLILSLALRLLKAPPFLKACQPPSPKHVAFVHNLPDTTQPLAGKGSSVCQTLTQSGWSTQGI